MAYTTINKSSLHMNTKLYTGNGSTQSITGVGFQPDWTWIKPRSTAGNHRITDAVRGATKQIYTDLTNAENTNTNGLTAFGTDGFTVGSDGGYNGNGVTFASWNWKANGAGSSNTDGSINSTVSANTTSGFSIVSYTGNGTNGATVGHGLGVTPDMMIVKNRDNGSYAFTVYHKSTGNSGAMFWGFTDAFGDYSNAGYLRNPNSSTFETYFTNHGNAINASGDKYITYCFAEKTGYSKFGSYTGNNNADGTFVYTGFKPAFVMIKDFSEGSSNWVMYDDKRSAVPDANINNRIVYANTSADYEIASGSRTIDTLSNGFKLRGNSGDINGTASYIYMAFAAAPLVGTNNVPCTAR